jgi:hypothetical protein
MNEFYLLEYAYKVQERKEARKPAEAPLCLHPPDNRIRVANFIFLYIIYISLVKKIYTCALCLHIEVWRRYK